MTFDVPVEIDGADSDDDARSQRHSYRRVDDGLVAKICVHPDGHVNAADAAVTPATMQMNTSFSCQPEGNPGVQERTPSEPVPAATNVTATTTG